MALVSSPSLQCDGSRHEFVVQMKSGEGEDSYLKNSSPQSHMLQVVEAPLWHGIRSASRIPETGHAGPALRVADLGCATGTNTIKAVDKLLESLVALWESKCGQLQLHPFPKDVQVFFSDLPSNDFNTLFRTLSPSGSGSRGYFAAGVPGSFYGPLFPASSIHAFTCFTALHWMSRVPPEVQDRNSPAFNFDRVHVHGAGPAVEQAFARQSSRDLTEFFTNRATELVPGGFLALAMLIKPDDQPDRQGIWRFLWDAFHELAVQGVIPRVLIETFNIPYYYPSIAQVRQSVDQVGLFDVHILQSCGEISHHPAHKRQEYRADVTKFAKDGTLALRSILQSSMQDHFGTELSNKVFEQFEQGIRTLNLQPGGEYVDDYFTTSYGIVLLTKK